METRDGAPYGGAEEAEDWVVSVSSDRAVDRITQGGAREEGEGFRGDQLKGVGDTLHGAQLHRALHSLGLVAGVSGEWREA